MEHLKKIESALISVFYKDGLALSLRHTREADLPDELDAMREHYAQQADATARRVGIVWQISAILGMGLAAGAVILAMFMPMIELYRRMSGN